ncbi:MAG: serine/threonine-protein kinase [Elusimicrobiota bacterium]
MNNRTKKIINNKYVIDRLIGVGGVAFVYKAWDKMLDKYVAVKKIHKEFANDAKFVDMFREEAVNTAKLEYENIVRVLNFVIDDGDYYMIMDYVNGVDLEYMLDKCKKRNVKVPEEIAVHIIAEITKALDYAHNLKDDVTGKPINIVHRDISPGNIMLYYDGRIKLTDFGIAKAGGDPEPKNNKIKGKLVYMSPEQAKCKDVDARSDLFGCGLVLYEILTGEKPYDGKSDIDIWKKAKNAHVDFSRLKEQNVSKDLIKILKRMLKKDSQARYQSAAEMFIDLKKYLSKSGSTAENEKKYTRFLSMVLKEEIDAADMETKKDMEYKNEMEEESDRKKSKESDNSAQNNDRYDEYRDDYYDQFDDEEEENEAPLKKRKKKAPLKFLFFIILAGGLGFGYFDLGKNDSILRNNFYKIYSMIDSESIVFKIDTDPSGADIQVIDSRGKDFLRESNLRTTTPVFISNIEKGDYTIIARREDFGTISRQMQINGNKENNGVLIANATKENSSYILPFDVKIRVNSKPGGASLYINGRNIGTTPYRGVLEVGRYNLQMFKEGFGELGVEDADLKDPDYVDGICVLDMSVSMDRQTGVDYRFWEVEERVTDKKKEVSVTGFLR